MCVAWSAAVSRERLSVGGRTPAYPVLLEAVLGAEVAVLDVEAEAFGALQSAGVVLAVDAKALPLRRRFLGHVVGRGAVGRGRAQLGWCFDGSRR